MQDFIDLITNNLTFFIGLFVFVVFVIGFVLALSTQAGRDALGKAAVKLAIAALGFAEKWLGLKIEPMPDSRIASNVPIRDSLTQWLSDFQHQQQGR